MWSNTRGAIYLSGLLAQVFVVVVVVMGWGTYDPETRMITPAPFSVDALAAFLPTVIAPALAFVAWLKNWTRR